MPKTETAETRTTDLLDAVNVAEVWQNADGVSHQYPRNVFGMTEPWREVTADVEALAGRGLVHLVDTPDQSGMWSLTKKGASVLRRRRHPSPMDRVRSLFGR